MGTITEGKLDEKNGAVKFVDVVDTFTDPRTIQRAWIPGRDGGRGGRVPGERQVQIGLRHQHFLKSCENLLGLFAFTQKSVEIHSGSKILSMTDLVVMRGAHSWEGCWEGGRRKAFKYSCFVLSVKRAT